MRACHPLEPLDADEIRAASAILRAAGHLREGVRVIGLTLHEPTRDDLRRFAPGQALDRAVFAILLDTASGETEEVVVSLTEGHVASSRRLRDVQPPIVWPPSARWEMPKRSPGPRRMTVGSRPAGV